MPLSQLNPQKVLLDGSGQYYRTCPEPRGGKIICFPFPYLRNSGSKSFFFFPSVPCFLLRLILRFGLSAVSSALIPRLSGWIGSSIPHFRGVSGIWSNNVKTRYDLLPIYEGVQRKADRR